jgi:hypothetical protein
MKKGAGSIGHRDRSGGKAAMRRNYRNDDIAFKPSLPFEMHAMETRPKR